MRFEIHPAIGIARLGNSPDSFYLEPETAGGRPTECDPAGNPVMDRGQPVAVEQFKDAAGLVRRQAARFRVYVYDDTAPNGREIALGKDVKSVE